MLRSKLKYDMNIKMLYFFFTVYAYCIQRNGISRCVGYLAPLQCNHFLALSGTLYYFCAVVGPFWPFWPFLAFFGRFWHFQVIFGPCWSFLAFCGLFGPFWHFFGGGGFVAVPKPPFQREWPMEKDFLKNGN